MTRYILAAALAAFAGPALAAGEAIQGAVQQAPTNWTAIAMFLFFVVATLILTGWAAKRTKSTAAFYTAGGGITGFQNGLALAGASLSADDRTIAGARTAAALKRALAPGGAAPRPDETSMPLSCG